MGISIPNETGVSISTSEAGVSISTLQAGVSKAMGPGASITYPWGDGIARKQQNVLTVVGNTLEPSVLGSKEKLVVSGGNGVTGIQTPISAVNKVVRMSIPSGVTGTFVPNNKEETDIKFAGESGTFTSFTGYSIAFSGGWYSSDGVRDRAAINFSRADSTTFYITVTAGIGGFPQSSDASALAAGAATVLQGSTTTGDNLEGTIVSSSGGSLLIDVASTGITLDSVVVTRRGSTSTAAASLSGPATTVTGTVTDFSLNLDTTHASSPVTWSSSSALGGIAMAAEARTAINAAITAGEVTGLTVMADTDDTVRLISTATGERVDATITVNNPNTATATVDVVDQGTTTSGELTGWLVKEGTTSLTTSTFASNVTNLVSLADLKSKFDAGDITGWTAGTITDTHFDATRTLGGVADDLVLSIPTAGSGGTLVVSSVTQTEGVDAYISGTLTTWAAFVDLTFYSGNYTSGADSVKQLSEPYDVLLDAGVDVSISGTELTIRSATIGDKYNFTLQMTLDGTDQTAEQFTEVNTDGTDAGDAYIDISGGGLVGTARLTLTESQTRAELLVLLDTTIDGNSGVFTYQDGGGDLEFASNNNETYPDVAISTSGTTGGIVITPSTKYIGYS